MKHRISSACFAGSLLGLLVVLFAREADAAGDKPTIVCGAKCPALEAPGAFELRRPATSCAPKANITLKFLEENSDAGSKDVGHCKHVSDDGDPAVYACELDHPEAIQANGKLSTALCDGEGDKKLVTEIPVQLASKPEASGRRPAPGVDVKPEGLGFLTMPLWRETVLKLGFPLEGHRLGHYYDQTNDNVILFFDADATPYFPIPDIIDEDDDIYVAIVDYADRFADTHIAIQGCNRPPVEPRIFGSGIGKALAETTGDEEPGRPLKIVLRAFGKCAGNTTGGPTLSVERDGKQNLVTLPVNPLYRLAVGVAFGYDATLDTSFAVRAPAGSSLTRVTKSRDRLGITPLVFVSFYPTARDFRKTDAKSLGQRLHLFVGMGTENFPDDFVVGGGVELTMGLNVLLGWHALTREKVLAEGSGLVNHSSFDGTTETLPLRERWAMGSVFVGFGLSSDLLARLR